MSGPEERSAGVVIYAGRPREYLLLHYPSGHWDFPKGHVEAGETDVQAAIREVQEETGLTSVQLHEGFDHAFVYVYRRDGIPISKTVRYFVGGTNVREIRISHEHRGFVWLPFEKARERITYANARDLLERAEAFLAKGMPGRPAQTSKR